MSPPDDCPGMPQTIRTDTGALTGWTCHTCGKHWPAPNKTTK